VDPTLILQLLLECELEGVTRLRCCEGMLPAWDAALFMKLEGLRILNLSSCQLSSLPSGIPGRMSRPCKLPVSAEPTFRNTACLLSYLSQGMRWWRWTRLDALLNYYQNLRRTGVGRRTHHAHVFADSVDHRSGSLTCSCCTIISGACGETKMH